MGDIVKLIQDLVASGQFGVIIIGLLLAVGGTVFIILLQRQNIARFDQLMAVHKEQFQVIVTTNDELRKELERYKAERKQFESDVKLALSIGFAEIRSSLAQTTVSELIEQIPENLRKDIENEIRRSLDKTIKDALSKFSGFSVINKEETIKKIVEASVNQLFRKTNRAPVLSSPDIQRTNQQAATEDQR